MGRELQKKKNRSSLPTIRQKTKSPKIRVQGHPIITSQWNRSQTFAQNYRRFGLASRLGAPAGGTEKRLRDVEGQRRGDGRDPLAIVCAAPRTTTVMAGEARIERDATGRIVRVVEMGRSRTETKTKRTRENPLRDPLNDLEEDDEEEEKEEDEGVEEDEGGDDDIDRPFVVRQLEEIARRPQAPPAPRTTSAAEEAWVEALVRRHGDDYGRMFWDPNLNPMQQSEGDIRRRVLRWKQRQQQQQQQQPQRMPLPPLVEADQIAE
ncbi:MAG: Nucleolar protein 16 [Phylliscum demangeonii]|nr:MAG: Nucleolar protein 16 [Phylliscum demangeonii]